MIKELKYNGYSASPSDYECTDGDLAAAVNVVNENGALHSISRPTTILSLSDNTGHPVFIHKTSQFIHYIILQPVENSTANNILYIDHDEITNPDNPTLNEITSDFLYSIQHFNAIGNTLMAFSSNGIYYFLWKDHGYILLGNQIPECPISFGLVGHPRLFSVSDDSKATFNLAFDPIDKSAFTSAALSDENKSRITEQVMAKVNKFIAQQTVEKGRFCFPFFVRYALRLYDGSLTRHSAPILMLPSTSAAPVVFTGPPLGKNHYDHCEGCDILLVAADLDYQLLNKSFAATLNLWSDIVKSVDIFISKPIYTYDQDGKISSFRDVDNINTQFIGRLFDNGYNPRIPGVWTHNPLVPVAEDSVYGYVSDSSFLDYYCEWKYRTIYSLYFSKDRSYPLYSLNLPEFSEDKIHEAIQNTSAFYFISSIPVQDLDDSRKTIAIDNEYLQSLVNRTVLTDDYLSNDRIHADYSFIYNSRLNIAGISRRPFDGFFPQAMFPYCNNACSVSILQDGNYTLKLTPSITPYRFSIDVLIKENSTNVNVANLGSDDLPLVPFISWTVSEVISTKDGETTYTDANGDIHSIPNVVTSTVTKDAPRSWGSYLFYPNTNAYRMIIYHFNPTTQRDEAVHVVDLRPHDFLNGAFAFLDFDKIRSLNYDVDQFQPPTLIPQPSDKTADTFPILMPNKIFTSEVNNPFYFPLSGINTVGTGNILGICAAAKALSEGQFGQFPLYAFTTEGVWALKVSDTGTYLPGQPITRDVCINPASITALDSTVIFATARGLMLLSGSTVQCISDQLASSDPFYISDLPNADKLIGIFNIGVNDLSFFNFQFSSFIANCRIIYDYTNQRIIVANPDYEYAYLFSLKSQLWTMMQSDISHTLNSYPDALAVATKNIKTPNATVTFTSVIDLSNPESVLPAIIITRPFKLDAHNVHKTINTIIQRGNFSATHVRQVLYGSNDLIHWHTVWSSVDMFMRGFRGTPYKYFRLAIVCRFDKAESLYGCTVVFEPRMTNQVR